ncbi:MAG TPA: AAC(3) family N-acetyltransferase [Anaerolineales bacterium]|jgi:aminoglycoside 3-N-acetyltransferase|nr:AAC(3) family N-acetyltransferase [Anaerolineales bacterium]HQX16527.1 AAC(3) family N-acetyltransferase [Anaerolineales bacterium]
MLDYIELKSLFQDLSIPTGKPVIIHASLKPFGYIQDGADAILRALMDTFNTIVVPTFTYYSMVTPPNGPSNNGMIYDKPEIPNEMSITFTPNLRADPMMGILPEALRNHQQANRSSHPLLSFAGMNADGILNTQLRDDPLAPIGALVERDGWVILINENHTSNTSIHYAEKLAGRKQFIRWALVDDRTVECRNYPGDSDGFGAIAPHLKDDTVRVELDKAFVEAMPIKRVIDVAVGLIKNDPLALLCEREDCLRCNAVRGIYAVG